MRTDSTIMTLFRKIGCESLAWSLRRLHCPASSNALVLEVGSGGNPYPRANVLLDGYEESVERVEKNLVKDRPFVMGVVENLPFKTKSFDFVIASHVLEHSCNPEAFLGELMRVSKAGYIETPDAFFELINPFTYHRLEVANIGGSKIRISLKKSWRNNDHVVDEFERQLKDKEFIKFTGRHPWPFQMRYYWQDNIDFEIVNPEVDCSWPLPEESYKKSAIVSNINFRIRFRYFLRKIMRWLFSQNSRNKKIDVLSLIQCPTCRSDQLDRNKYNLKCTQCGTTYPVINDIPVMYPRHEVD